MFLARAAAAGLAGSTSLSAEGSDPSRNRNAAPSSARELSCSTCQLGVCSKKERSQFSYVRRVTWSSAQMTVTWPAPAR